MKRSLLLPNLYLSAAVSMFLSKKAPPLRIDESCSPFYKGLLLEDWQAAGDLANSHTKWYPGGQYQPVMDQYLGSQSSADWSPTSPSGEGPLRQNVLRANGIFHQDAEWSPLALARVEIFCDDENNPEYGIPSSPDNKACSAIGKSSELRAYTWEDAGIYIDSMFIVICSTNFFKLPRMLQAQNEQFPDYFKSWMDTRACVLLSQVYQWSAVSSPRCSMEPEKTAMTDVMLLASQENTPKARLNRIFSPPTQTNSERM